jgi:hypothetical protein
MARQSVEIKTKLTMNQSAQLFREAMRVSWLSENITGAGTTFEETPSGAFDSLNADPADFSVMATLGGRGAEIQKSAVHMYMWDRGDHREIVLGIGKNLGALGIKANSKIRRFAAALQAADPSTSYTGI